MLATFPPRTTTTWKSRGEEALGAEPLEPLAAHLNEHAVAYLDHLAGAEPVRVRAPEERAHDLFGVLARLPRALAGGMPRDVVVQALAQLGVLGATGELVDLSNRGEVRRPSADERKRLDDAGRLAAGLDLLRDRGDRLRRLGVGLRGDDGSPGLPARAAPGRAGLAEQRHVEIGGELLPAAAAEDLAASCSR